MNKPQTAILLDTNVYISGFFLSPPERLEGFRNFLDTKTAILLIPSVVDLEVKNQLHKIVHDDVDTISKSRLFKFGLLKIPKKEELEQKLLDLYRGFIGGVPHQKIDCDQLKVAPLIEKAISKRKPFNPAGRGFQDAVIWEALVDYLQHNKGHEIVFITQNTKDFGKDGKLDDGLLQDLMTNNLENRAQYFNSLQEFLAKCVRPVEFIDEVFLRSSIDEYVIKVAASVTPEDLHMEVGKNLNSRTEIHINNVIYIRNYRINSHYILAEDTKNVKLVVEFAMDFMADVYLVKGDEMGEICDVDHQEHMDISVDGSCILEVDKKKRSVVLVGN